MAAGDDQTTPAGGHVPLTHAYVNDLREAERALSRANDSLHGIFGWGHDGDQKRQQDARLRNAEAGARHAYELLSKHFGSHPAASQESEG